MLHTPDRLALPSQDPFLLNLFVWFAFFFFSGWLYNVGVRIRRIRRIGYSPARGLHLCLSILPGQIHLDSLPCINA